MATDNMIQTMVHQGKTIAQWVEDFNGMFTAEQIIAMAKGGCDLQKVLVMGLDESDLLEDDYSNLPFSIDDNVSESANGHLIEFVVFNKDGTEAIRNRIEDKDATDFNMGYLSELVNDYNDAAKAFPDSMCQTAAIYVDGKPLSSISTVRKAQLRRLLESMKKNNDAMLDESTNIEIYTVNDLISRLNNYAQPNDKLACKLDGKLYDIDEIASKGGVATMSFVPAIAERPINETFNPDVETAADLIEAINEATHGKNNSAVLSIEDRSGTLFNIKSIEMYKGDLHIEITESGNAKARGIWENDEDDEDGNKSFPDAWDASIEDKNGKEFNIVVYGKDEATAKAEADNFLKTHKIDGGKVLHVNPKSINEGRNWRTGGYGGYGRSYASYGEVKAPRGKAISWFAVADLDPKAKGKMNDWRVGPSNFPFKDLLYPERKYKVGTTVLRSKFLKAGDESGVKYIAIPSYIEAIRNNDEAAIELLKALDIPLDLTFGYSPDEDFSSTYTIQ